MRTLFVPVVLLGLTGACGDGGERAPVEESRAPPESGEAADPPRTLDAAEAKPPSEEVRPPDSPRALAVGSDRPAGGAAPADTVVLTARGPELAFYPDRFTAESGSVVVIRFENGGELPHNFVLVRDDAAIDALVTAAYEAADADYVPMELRDALIAFSPLLSPGGTADMEVVIPPPGEYTYICLFPGHAQMMLGTLRSR